ncbi:YerC/YecD family TrpR-related protein [Paenibacillus sp. 481]|uniref:YerC/YecD family TrpR-related protein n=1 Tax=Paenibacillus sp. 481 TaxID=2835869 RepID=UPI001E49DAE9|nr:YerC/YecD family TrpR-related protein [Paenibacillus sp. 481]UHA73134.1 TrpR-related protein YerC/YecD [Paenibacillus sp. 481]
MVLKKVDDANMEQLFDVMLMLENKEECYAFFEDLTTTKEIQTLSQRLQVAKMLLHGSTYLEIEVTTGASTAIISRIKRSLQHGNGSYKLMLERLAARTQS